MIPVLVIACNRVTVQRCLDKLIEYRPPGTQIIVSQDCGHAETAAVISTYASKGVMHIEVGRLHDGQDEYKHVHTSVD